MVMHATALKRRVTLAEYLAFEETAAEKHILWDGEIFPMWGMAGALPAHNVIAGNAYAALHAALRGRGCRPFNSDQKIWVPLQGGVVYPDVSVVCGKASLHAGTRDTFDNPVAVVEVLAKLEGGGEAGKARAQDHDALRTGCGHVLMLLRYGRCGIRRSGQRRRGKVRTAGPG